MLNKRLLLVKYFIRGIFPGIYVYLKMANIENELSISPDIIVGALIFSLPLLAFMSFSTFVVRYIIYFIKGGVKDLLIMLIIIPLLILRAFGMGADESFFPFMIEAILGSLIIIFIEEKIIGIEKIDFEE